MLPTFENSLARNWGWFLLRAAGTLVFFLFLAFMRPLDPEDLAILVGIYFLFNGISIATQGALASNRETVFGWAMLCGAGLLTIVMGVVSLVGRHAMLSSMLWWWGAWGFVFGMLEIISGIRLQTETEEWLLILSGLFSLTFGFCIGTVPLLGLNFLVWSFATYAACYCITLAWLSRRLYLWHYALPPRPEPPEQPAPGEAGAMHSEPAQAPQ